MASPATLAPQSLEAEADILGAMMLDSRAVDAVAEVLEPDGAQKFYRQSNGVIYEVALGLHRVGLPVDAVSLYDAVAKREPRIEKARIHELAGLVPVWRNAAHHAKIVREKWMLRRLALVASTIAGMGDGDGVDPAALILEAERLFEETRGQMERERDLVVSMYDAAMYLSEKFKHPPDLGSGVPTPWSFLPSMQGGRLYVLGGYPADGKTVQAHHYFRTAISAKIPTGLVTLEMAWQDLVERLAANMGLPAKRVQTGRFEDQVQRDMAANVVGRMAMFADVGKIIDAPACTVADLRRYVKTLGLRFLIVDHLHMFQLDPQHQRESIEEIIRGIWSISREFDIPVLLLAQLSRTGDKARPFPRPTMAQIKGSGAIEQLAWSVHFVWRERDEMNLPEQSGATEYLIAKNRSGETGMRRIRFVPRETRFEEIQREG